MYHFATEIYQGTKTIQPADCFIFEGILSMYDETINKLADLKVFIDVSDDERLIRRIMRDQKERGSPIEKTIKM
jgi:uridine kinase